jgi:hypothetical protein
MHYKRKYDKRRGSFCKMCKYGKRLGNNSVEKTDRDRKLESKIKEEMKDAKID